MPRKRLFSLPCLFSRRDRREPASHGPSFRPIFESLEDRQLLAYGVALAGADATFTGDAAADVLTLSVDGSGNLMHNLPISGNLVSAVDLDSTAPGEQASLVSALTGLTVDDAANHNDTVTLGGANPFNFTLSTEVSITTEVIIVEQNLATGAGHVALDANERIIIRDTGGIATTSGDITLMANQSATPLSGSFTGIEHSGSISTVDGDILLKGRSGDTIFQGAAVTGVQTLAGSSIVSTGTGAGAGTITLDGNGARHGVDLHGDMSSVDGDIAVTAIAQRDQGVQLTGGATIVSLGTGTNAATITIDGTTAGLNPLSNSLQILDAGTMIGSIDGDISITGSGGAQDGVLLKNGAVISSTGAAGIVLMGQGNGDGVVMGADSHINSTSSGNISLTGTGGSGDGVHLQYGATINSAGTGPTAGTITINGTGNGLPGSPSDGVQLAETDTRIQSVDGNIQITGNTSPQAGVYVTNSAVVESTGTADIAMLGQGGEYGLLIGSNSQINTAGSGGILLTGSGDTADGARIFGGATINSTGTGTSAGTITMNGTGNGAPGSASDGVEISGSAAGVHSVDGNIDITGNSTGGAGVTVFTSAVVQSTGTANVTLMGQGATSGFSLAAASTMSSTGNGPDAGAITISGTGNGATAASSYSVQIKDAGTGIYSVDGNIAITGNNSDSAGVALFANPIVESTGSADIMLMGQGGTHGLFIDNSSQINTTAGGNILLTGIGDTVDGLLIQRGSTINSTGTGPTAGTITLNGTGNGAAGSDGVDLRSAGTGIHSVVSDISVTTDTLQLIDATIASAGALTIQPMTAGTTIGLGGGAGTLNLTDAELALLSDGFASITIGDSSAAIAARGNVDINTATFTDPVTIAGNAIHDHAGTDIDAGTNTVTLDGIVSPGQSPGILTVTGDFTFADGDTYTVEIGGTSPGTAATNHDQIDATGSVTIGTGATLDLVDFNSFGATITGGETFEIINRTGGTGTFSGLGEGATISNFLGSGLDATISYVGDDGDDVVLSVMETAVVAETEVALNAGALTITDINGGTSDDDLTIVLIHGGADIQISDPIHEIAAGMGVTAVDAHTVTVPAASVTAGAVFDLLGGDDLLTVDLSGGDPVAALGAGGLMLQGGAGGNDELVLDGGGVTDATYGFDNATDGSVALDGSVITYTGLDPITQHITATNVTLNYSDAGETITVTETPGLVWVDYISEIIYTANSDGFHPHVFVDPADTIKPWSVFFNRDYLFWATFLVDAGIHRASLDGSEPQLVVDDADIPSSSIGTSVRYPHRVTADANFVYWADLVQDAIYRANLDGADPHVLVDPADIPRFQGQPQTDIADLAVDQGFVYWVEPSAGGGPGQPLFYRAELDGSNPEVLIDVVDLPKATGDHPLFLPNEIAIAGGFLYWADRGQDAIYRANIDGTNPEVLIDAGDVPPSETGFHPRGIAVDDTSLYWGSEFFQGVDIYRANLDGTSIEVLIGNDDIPTFADGRQIISLAVLPQSSTMVTSTAGETVFFPAPTGALTINAGAVGDDVVNIVNLVTNHPGSIEVDGQGGTDTINLNGNLSTGSRDMTLIAETVTPSPGAVEVLVGTATVNARGNFAPGGAAVGHTTIDGDVSLDGLTVNLDGHVTDFDQLRVAGAGRTVDLAGADLAVELSFTPFVGEEFLIVDLIDAASTTSGTFAGLPEGAALNVGGLDLTISYTAGDGNDVSLTHSNRFPAKTPVAPLGGLIYDPIVDGVVSLSGDSVDYEIDLDPGQTVTVMVTSEGELDPVVELFDPMASSVASGPAVADVALLQTAAVEMGGTYHLSVSGAGGTTGLYTVQIILNAAIEEESLLRPDNDATATAEDINSSFINLGQANVERAAVVGRVGIEPLFLYGADNGGANFLLVDQATGTSTVIASDVGDGVGYTDLAYNPVTRIMYASAAQGETELYSVDPATGAETVVIDADLDNLQMAWSPDATTLYVVHEAEFGTLDITDGTFTQIRDLDADGLEKIGGIAFQPGTGTLFAIEARGTRLYTLDLADGTPTFIADTGESWNALEFLPDGTLLGGVAVSGDCDACDGSLREIDPITGVHTFIGVYAPDSENATGLEAVATPDSLDDHFRVQLQAGDVVTLILSGISGADLELLNPSGTIVATGVTGATNVDLAISNFEVATPGAYVARIAYGGAANDYSLVVTRNATFDLEDNNDAGSAQDLGDNQGVLGHLGADGADYYSFEVAAAGAIISLSTHTPADGPGEFVNLFDPVLDLFDPTGASVATDDNSAGDGRNADLSHQAQMAGTYTVLVTGAGSTTGEYVLSVDVAGGGGPEPVDQVLIDNDVDPATFSVVSGSFTLFNDSRFVNGDVRYATGPGKTARWTFPALNAGVFDVAATWVTGGGRAPNAPYRVYLDGALVREVRVDQRVAPDDFTAEGATWETLDTLEIQAGQTLTVELSTDGTTGYVYADAVYARVRTTPEIVVFDGATELADGTGSVEMIVTQQPSKTFTVRNVGGGTLHLMEPIQVPTGFRVDQSFGQTSLMPGQSATFVVAFDGGDPAVAGGQIVIGNDDADENPFEFSLAAGTGVQIVDDGDLGFSQTGPTAFTRYVTGAAHAGDVHYHNKGTGANYVDYVFTGLTPGSYYQVATTWTVGGSRASNAPYQIHAGVNPPATHVPETTVLVDQRYAPADFSDAGTNWDELALVQVPAGESALTVRLSDAANNWVYADAVRLELVYLPEVHVLVDGQPLPPGAGIDFGQLLRGAPGTQSIEVVNAGQQTLEITNLSLPNVPGLVTTSSGFGTGQFALGESFFIDVDVDTSIDTGLAAGSYSWSITFNANDADEPLTTIPVAAEIIDRLVLDDNGPEFSVGPGTYFSAHLSNANAYLNTVHFSNAATDPTTVQTVQWEVPGLAPGTYDISLTWFQSLNRATDSPFTVFDGLGNQLAQVDVNQDLAPDDFTYGGKGWELVFPGVPVSDEGDGTGTLVIQLTNDANQWVVADAAMVQFVAPTGQGLRAAEFRTEEYVRLSSLTHARRESPAPAAFTAADLSAAADAAIRVWQSTGLTAAESARLDAVDVRFASLPNNVLGWAAADGARIWIDTDAAGYGWQVSQERRAESGELFPGSGPSRFSSPLSTLSSQPRMDLLTVLAHELGHVLRRDHADDHGPAVMNSQLGAGERALPGERLDVRGQSLGIGGQQSAVSQQPSHSGLPTLDSRPSTLDSGLSTLDSRPSTLSSPLPARDSSLEMDLVTAVMHEVGHVLGYDHDDCGVMHDELSPGIRQIWNELGDGFDFG